MKTEWEIRWIRPTLKWFLECSSKNELTNSIFTLVIKTIQATLACIYNLKENAFPLFIKAEFLCTRLVAT